MKKKLFWITFTANVLALTSFAFEMFALGIVLFVSGLLVDYFSFDAYDK